MKLSFSLNSKKPAASAQTAAAPKPALKPAAVSAFGDDDEPELAEDADQPARSSKPRGDVNRLLAAKSASAAQTKAEKKRIAQELRVDRTVFQYDEVYDAMKDSEVKAKEAKDEDKERKPKYVEGLLQFAETRRLDRLRAEEKLMHREREAEGDEFADKETFVTQAYKDQLAAVRKAEEEEKAREAAQKRKGPQLGGMAHFYKSMLEKSEAVHSAAVAATAQPAPPASSSSGPSLTIAKPPNAAVKGPIAGPSNDVELARQAREAGKDVELNDDNQIVDKRELLNAGLNLSLPNTRHLDLSAAKRNKGGDGDEPVITHRAVGTAATRQEIAARRQQEIDKQWQEERERARAERERKEQEERDNLVKRRNDDDAVSSARERYLARKRQKLEDGSAAPTGNTPES